MHFVFLISFIFGPKLLKLQGLRKFEYLKLVTINKVHYRVPKIVRPARPFPGKENTNSCNDPN